VRREGLERDGDEGWDPAPALAQNGPDRDGELAQNGRDRDGELAQNGPDPHRQEGRA
jgi:hypothetical protein